MIARRSNLMNHTVRVAAASAVAVVAATVAPATPAEAHTRHTIRPGETLTQISRQYRVPVWRLVRRNRITNPNLIYAGDRLVIRRGRHHLRVLSRVRVSRRSVRGPIPAAGGWNRHGGYANPAWDINIPGSGDCGNPVRAFRRGRVVAVVSASTSYGNRVVVRHPKGMRTLYAHLRRRSVSRGQHVVRGQLVGRVGSTGNSTGCHLHFEKRWP